MARRKTAARSSTQIAALPFRTRDGVLEVLLITSRETRQWIIPKGWRQKSRPPHDVAIRKARQEAGLVGRIAKRSIGSYRYEKRLAANDAIACKVRIFPLEVERQLDDWPEKGERDLCWLSPAEAVKRITDKNLRQELMRSSRLLRKKLKRCDLRDPILSRRPATFDPRVGDATGLGRTAGARGAGAGDSGRGAGGVGGVVWVWEKLRENSELRTRCPNS
jgi:8-oxo-dGTP pyrophosphatase MutT (NUDIX family)